MSPAVISVDVLVNVVTQVDNIVNGIFASWITESVEKAKRKVAARVNGQSDLRYEIIRCGSSLRAPNDAGFIGGAANAELIIILRVCLEVLGFDLDGICQSEGLDNCGIG